MAPFMGIGRETGFGAAVPQLRIEADPNGCIGCGKCDRACPMSLPVQDLLAGGAVADANASSAPPVPTYVPRACCVCAWAACGKRARIGMFHVNISTVCPLRSTRALLSNNVWRGERRATSIRSKKIARVC